MAEEDPREYRGGVHEPADAKGGPETAADTEGIVPREMLDDPPPEDESDPQGMKDAAMGEVTHKDPQDDSIDHSAGDEADATRLGGTGVDAEEAEEGTPVSRVDQVDVTQRSDDVGA